MPYDYDLPFKPIQVLAIACTTLGDETSRSAWLHGYAVLTVQPTSDDVEVTGDVIIGDRYVDDARLVTSLNAALKSDAVLAGLDLTSAVAQLSLLPIDIVDQRPALSLLDKIETMLGEDAPIDVAIDIQSRLTLALTAIEHKLHVRHAFTEPADASELQYFGSSGSLNSSQLAVELADTVSAATLTIGEIYLDPQQNEQLIASWQRWRQTLQSGLEANPAATEHHPVN